MDRKIVPLFQIKLVLAGDAAVGKTSLVYRFETDKYETISRLTVGFDLAKKDIYVRVKRNSEERKEVRVCMWDTAGQERYAMITRGAMRYAHGIIVVFDVTSHRSFENVPKWIGHVRAECPQASLLIIGNKTDSPNREVTIKEAKCLAESQSAFYYETSAKTGDNVAFAFDEFISEVCWAKEIFIPKIEADTKQYNAVGQAINLVLPQQPEETLMTIQPPPAQRSCCF